MTGYYDDGSSKDCKGIEFVPFLACSYTCQKCSTATGCTSCAPGSNRTLNATACPCDSTYFDDGSSVNCQGTLVTIIVTRVFADVCQLPRFLHMHVLQRSSCARLRGDMCLPRQHLRERRQLVPRLQLQMHDMHYFRCVHRMCSTTNHE
jgi:hypothetical protein